MNILLTHSDLIRKDTICLPTISDDVVTHSLFFTEKKKNIIIDGVFSKIIYSNQYFTMNGLYIEFRICSKLTQENPLIQSASDQAMNKHNYMDGGFSVIERNPTNKNYIQYNPTNEKNIRQIEGLCELEVYILHCYATRHFVSDIPKTPIYSLKTQLYSGYIKVHQEESVNSTEKTSIKCTKYIKISGVWENNHSYGITYKVIYV